jgi:hypothetical protein
MTTPQTPIVARRRLRYLLTSLVAVAVTLTLFHTEKDWKDSFEESVHSWAWKLIPRGWVWQNMVAGANLFGKTIAFNDPSRHLVFPDKANEAREKADAVFSHWSPYTFMASIMIPNFARACQTCAQNQTEVNQALIACALERYHLAHGEYPETLDALLPSFVDAIPHDVIGGNPPHYRRNSDGTFLLYSIGWSQQDHGGHIGDQKDSDLVWPEN